MLYCSPLPRKGVEAALAACFELFQYLEKFRCQVQGGSPVKTVRAFLKVEVAQASFILTFKMTNKGRKVEKYKVATYLSGLSYLEIPPVQGHISGEGGRGLENKRAAAGAPAEEQAAKRTNTEVPPGGGGHVASNNGGAGVAL